MTWRQLLDQAYEAREGCAQLLYAPGADRHRLEALELELCRALPLDLKELLAESDGVMDVLECGDSLVPNLALIWSCDEILSADRVGRAASDHVRPPRDLLIFASAGTDGILFGYRPERGNGEIVAWHPMEDHCEPVASSLKEFLLGWVGGQVVV